MKTILVTGSAGFIGSNLVLRLFKELGEGTIVGLDNLKMKQEPVPVFVCPGVRFGLSGGASEVRSKMFDVRYYGDRTDKREPAI